MISALPYLRSGWEVVVRQQEGIDPALREGVATKALVGEPDRKLLARRLLKPAPNIIRVGHLALLRLIQHLLVSGMHRHLLRVLQMLILRGILLRRHFVVRRRDRCR